MTTVYVTHDQREAITMSDRIAVMNNGRIEQLDGLEALHARPKTKFVASFIGESNFIPVECRKDRIWYDRQPLKVACDAPHEGRHWLVARPEKVRVASSTATLNGVNVLSATVRDVVYQGDGFLCYATLAGGEQIALRDYCRSDILSLIPGAGEQIRLQILAEDANIVVER